MKPTILFVDDEVINLFVLKKRFEDNYEVLTAESGEDALEIIRQSSSEIDAVISDLRMPGIDGIEFINEARKNIPDTHFFLLTGYDYNEQINDAVTSGLVTSFFKKPFDHGVIHKTLQETFNGDSA